MNINNPGGCIPWHKKYWGEVLPEIGYIAIPTRETAVAMALNTGNRGNFTVLLRHLNTGLEKANKLVESDVLEYLEPLTVEPWVPGVGFRR